MAHRETGLNRRNWLKIAGLSAALAARLPGQESYGVFQQSPRVLLNEDRLRLLRREVERRTARWVQLEMLLQGGAQFPEPAFAYALGHLATGDADLAAKAISAVGPRTGIRGIAQVRDWCRPALKPADLERFDQRLLAATTTLPSNLDDPGLARDATLAAVALADDYPKASADALRWVHTIWWPHQLARIGKGQIPVAHGEALAFVEVLYSFEKALQLDLREGASDFFRSFPIWHLLRHYPASLPGGENDYRVPAFAGNAQPDPDVCARSRAAELAMVALDTNAEANQYLQGWLLSPRFRMRSAYGAPYEFFWCNPYQPSLSYFHLPLYQHLPAFGTLLARSSWEENASWFGLIQGQMQYFTLDGIKVLTPPTKNGILALGPSTLVLEGTANPSGEDSVAEIPECDRVFWLGLRPSARYLVEIDGEEQAEAETDPGGILSVDFSNRPGGGMYIRPKPS